MELIIFSIRCFLSRRQSHCARSLGFYSSFTQTTQWAVARCQSSPGISHPVGGFYRSTVPVSRDVLISFPFQSRDSTLTGGSTTTCCMWHGAVPAHSRSSVNIWMNIRAGTRGMEEIRVSPGAALPVNVLRPLWDHGHQGSPSPS